MKYYIWLGLVVLLAGTGCNPKRLGDETSNQLSFKDQLKQLSDSLKPYFQAKPNKVRTIENQLLASGKGLEIETAFPINELSFSSDNQLLASCGIEAGSQVQVWDLTNGLLKSTGEKGYYHNPTFTPDNQYVISSTVQSIIVWNIQKQQVIRKFSFPSRHIVLDRKGLLVCEDSIQRIFLTDFFSNTFEEILPEGDTIVNISFGSSEESLELLTPKKAIIWENKQIYQIGHSLAYPISSRFSWRNGRGALINEAGNSFMVKDAQNQILWQVKGKELVGKNSSQLSAEEQKLQDLMSTRGFYDMVGFSPNGKYLVTIYHTFENHESVHCLRIFESATGKLLFESVGNVLDMNTLAFSPDGQYIAVGLGDNLKREKGKILVYDLNWFINKK